MSLAGLDPLVELFSVHVFIDGVDDPSSVDIEGEFKVYDLESKHFEFYKRAEGSPSVLPDGTLSLVAPPRCLASPHWGFKIHLYDKRRNLEICNGSWNCSPDDHYMNEGPPLSTIVYGKHGCAFVNYLVYELASQARIEVSVDTLGSKGGDAPAIHGFIRAKNDLNVTADSCFEEQCKITLFHAPIEKPQVLEGGTRKIVLSRSCVVVPSHSKLIVEANLSQGAREFADGYASFNFRMSGTTSQSIGGVTVKVSWFKDPFESVGMRRP